MNDSMSILLATTVLALGGLGLYMFKSSDETTNKEDDNEDSLFGTSSFFNWGSDNSSEQGDKSGDEKEDPDEDVKARKRAPKTHKNRKSSGTSRRKY